MEGSFSIGIRDGTANCEAGCAIEARHTDHKCWAAAPLFVTRLWIKRDRHEFTLQWNIAPHHQTSFPTTLPQLSSPPNAFGELAAMRSSMRCRPRIGREAAAGVIVICELFPEISTITADPTAIPRDSTIDFGSRTPWLFPQRCNVVFMRGSIATGYPQASGKFFAPPATQPQRGWVTAAANLPARPTQPRWGWLSFAGRRPRVGPRGPTLGCGTQPHWGCAQSNREIQEVTTGIVTRSGAPLMRLGQV